MEELIFLKCYQKYCLIQFHTLKQVDEDTASQLK